MHGIIHKIARRIPQYGAALHGKPYKYVEHIKREGLTPHRREEVYFCPLPPKNVTKLPPREVMERTIGSILHATTWALRGNVNDRRLPEGELPAILILKGNKERPFIGSYKEEE